LDSTSPDDIGINWANDVTHDACLFRSKNKVGEECKIKLVILSEALLDDGKLLHLEQYQISMGRIPLCFDP